MDNPDAPKGRTSEDKGLLSSTKRATDFLLSPSGKPAPSVPLLDERLPTRRRRVNAYRKLRGAVETGTDSTACYRAMIDEGRFIVIHDGWNNRILLTRNRKIVKLPKTRQAKEKATIEADAGAALNALLGNYFPEYEYCGPFLGGGEDFISVRTMISGRPLRRTHDRGSVLAELAGILAGLHALSPTALPFILKANHAGWYRPLTEQAVARDDLDAQARATLTAAMAMIEAAEADSGTPCIVYGDMKPDHVITGKGRIKALIDLQDCRLDHPESDLALLCHFLPPEDYLALRTAYRGRGMPVNDRLVRSYGLIFQLDIALRAIAEGQGAMLGNALGEMESIIAAFDRIAP